jgi:hypothetical protein
LRQFFTGPRNACGVIALYAQHTYGDSIVEIMHLE